ncbi:unnamed protein product [Closterium sp. NIES-65]|nr:unnamed protein product [Closterium sp. NIES-65]
MLTSQVPGNGSEVSSPSHPGYNSCPVSRSSYNHLSIHPLPPSPLPSTLPPRFFPPLSFQPDLPRALAPSAYLPQKEALEEMRGDVERLKGELQQAGEQLAVAEKAKTDLLVKYECVEREKVALEGRLEEREKERERERGELFGRLEECERRLKEEEEGRKEEKQKRKEEKEKRKEEEGKRKEEKKRRKEAEEELARVKQRLEEAEAKCERIEGVSAVLRGLADAAAEEGSGSVDRRRVEREDGSSVADDRSDEADGRVAGRDDEREASARLKDLELHAVRAEGEAEGLRRELEAVNATLADTSARLADTSAELACLKEALRETDAHARVDKCGEEGLRESGSREEGGSREEVEQRLKEAEAQRDAAEKQREEAERQREEAERRKEEAEREWKEAEKGREDAEERVKGLEGRLKVAERSAAGDTLGLNANAARDSFGDNNAGGRGSEQRKEEHGNSRKGVVGERESVEGNMDAEVECFKEPQKVEVSLPKAQLSPGKTFPEMDREAELEFLRNLREDLERELDSLRIQLDCKSQAPVADLDKACLEAGGDQSSSQPTNSTCGCTCCSSCSCGCSTRNASTSTATNTTRSIAEAEAEIERLHAVRGDLERELEDLYLELQREQELSAEASLLAEKEWERRQEAVKMLSQLERQLGEAFGGAVAEGGVVVDANGRPMSPLVGSLSGSGAVGRNGRGGGVGGVFVSPLGGPRLEGSGGEESWPYLCGGEVAEGAEGGAEEGEMGGMRRVLFGIEERGEEEGAAAGEEEEPGSSLATASTGTRTSRAASVVERLSLEKEENYRREGEGVEGKNEDGDWDEIWSEGDDEQELEVRRGEGERRGEGQRQERETEGAEKREERRIGQSCRMDWPRSLTEESRLFSEDPSLTDAHDPEPSHTCSSRPLLHIHPPPRTFPRATSDLVTYVRDAKAALGQPSSPGEDEFFQHETAGIEEENDW